MEILSQQRLEKNSKVLQSKEAVQILIRKDFNEMKNRAFAAEDAGKDDRARWMYQKLIDGLDNLEDPPYEESKMILLRVARFYKRVGDYTEADHIIQKFFLLKDLMSDSSLEKLCSSLFEEFLEKTLPSEISFDLFTFTNIFPPLHRIVKYSRHVPRSLFRPSRHTGISLPKDFIGRTLLHVAAEKGNLEFLRFFIDQGHSIEARDELGRTPIFIAASLGRVAALDLLRNEGANLRVRDLASHFLMEVAARGNHTAIIRRLVDADCDVNKIALSKFAPNRALPALYAAAEKGHFEAVHLLIECDADPFTEALNTGKTAEQLSRDNGFTYVADFLKSRMASRRPPL